MDVHRLARIEKKENLCLSVSLPKDCKLWAIRRKTLALAYALTLQSARVGQFQHR